MTTPASPALARVRFFPRQLLSADDLTTEQEYFRRRLRNHNRYLHGWGVACGCDVQAAPDAGAPWQVRITPGYVLTPQGDEVLIAQDALFDLATCAVTSDDACAFARPCPPAAARALQSKTVWVAVRASECEARPVRVSPSGCGCEDDASCEYSRALDAYELGCLTALPASHPPPAIGCRKLESRSGVFPCPEAIDDPWVVLATVTLPQSSGGQIASIDLDRDRRVLYATAMLQELAFCSVATGAWYSIRSDVHHTNPDCTTGNNIEEANLRQGTGGRRKCDECARLDARTG